MNMRKCQEYIQWGQFTSTISNNLHDAIVGTAGIECLHFSMQFVSLVYIIISKYDLTSFHFH